MNNIPREDEAELPDADENISIGQNQGSEVELATIQSLNISFNSIALRVVDLTASYRSDLAPVIRDANFLIYPKEKIAIVGRTGSGKTSLIQCVTRLI